MGLCLFDHLYGLLPALGRAYYLKAHVRPVIGVKQSLQQDGFIVHDHKFQ